MDTSWNILSRRLGHHATWFCFVLFVGVVLRNIFPADMEFKADERWMFLRAVGFGHGETWRWAGMASGQGNVTNPGLSVWIFIALVKVFGITSPLGLGRAVMGCNSVALLVLGWFSWKKIPVHSRATWIWGTALLAVNPISILYERKIWAQSMLPIFCVGFLIAIWNRKTHRGAFAWGLIGALLGQVHMPGFFYAFAIFFWIAIWDRKSTRWFAWMAGSALGALPLIPWAIQMLHTPSGGVVPMISLNFFKFWLTSATGTGLSFVVAPIGAQNFWEIYTRFLAFPTINGFPTYLIGIAHAISILATIIILCGAACGMSNDIQTRQRTIKQTLSGNDDPTALLQQAALLGYGLLLTVLLLPIFRHYLLVAYPLPSIWLARQALPRQALQGKVASRTLLILLIISSTIISIGLLSYVHINNGVIEGDYGPAYHVTADKEGL